MSISLGFSWLYVLLQKLYSFVLVDVLDSQPFLIRVEYGTPHNGHKASFRSLQLRYLFVSKVVGYAEAPHPPTQSELLFDSKCVLLKRLELLFHLIVSLCWELLGSRLFPGPIDFEVFSHHVEGTHELVVVELLAQASDGLRL